jgi:voltage-gated potassium channel
MGGLGTAAAAFFKDRATGGLLLVFLIAILVLEFGSLAVLAAERPDSDANITTAADAVWYTIVTMSTVGYGDQYPVTNIGRVIGSLIIVIGVGVFGTLTGFLANAFLSPSRPSASTSDPETSD